MTPISLDLLRDLVGPEAVTEPELEVLALAIAGKSPSEIKSVLGIPSENAVQKRLAKIYARFRIAGAGPGKLPKLQKILSDRLYALQSPKKVLLLWLNENPHLAEGLKSVFKHPQIESVLVYTRFDAFLEAQPTWQLEKIEFGILCLSGDAPTHPLVNFAAGCLVGQIPNFRILNFTSTPLPESLASFTVVNGFETNKLAQLLHDIVGGDLDESSDWVNLKLNKSSWLDDLPHPNQSAQTRTPKTLSLFSTGLELLHQSAAFLSNTVFRHLITHFLQEVADQMERVATPKSIFSMPLELYPRYLAFLQRELQVRVTSVAIVNSVEHFWREDEGDEIGETANATSERLFVFSDEKDFSSSENFLLRHALHYNVFVTTKDIYEPCAAEFSLRKKNQSKQEFLEQWGEDFSLPTKEFGVIAASDGSQVLAWHDEDNLKGQRTQRLVHFSPITGEIDHYKKFLTQFLERAHNNQGVFQIQIDQKHSEKIPKKFDHVRDRLFRQPTKEPIRPPEDLLIDLQSMKNQLIGSKSKKEIIQKALKIVRQRLNAQTASIFLFSKDGCLHREGIEGIDAAGNLIQHETFFVGENYAPNESFTGKAAMPRQDRFGKPQVTNHLNEEQLNEDSKQEYSNALGSINCAIAVPLDGRNKTYGVLEVINRIDPVTQTVIPHCGFLQEEVHWLSAISVSIATAISNSRRDRQNQLYSSLCDVLVRYSEPKSVAEDAKSIYAEVAKRLISEETAFEVCILRVKQEINGLDVLQVVAEAAVNNKLEGRLRQGRKAWEGLVGEVLELREPKIVQRIHDELDKFKNRKWIEQHQFKSFCCFPLLYDEKIVGTLSLYTGYEYEFHRGTLDFLGRVASLVAAFIGKVNDQQELAMIKASLDKQMVDHPSHEAIKPISTQSPSSQPVRSKHKRIEENYHDVD